MKKSWITNPRGSKDSYRKKTMNKIKKEGDGGVSGSFGDGGGTVFTSSDAGIFTPTHTDRSKRPKKRKSTGISRLGDFITDNSPERKMQKSNNFLVDLVKWVTLELRKEDKKRFTRQTSGETINEQIPRIDWKKEEDKNPVEFDAEPDDQADIKQNDETNRIKALDDNQGEDDDKPKDTGTASLASPAGLTVNLAWESGGYQSDELLTGGDKDKKQGEIEDPEDKHSDEEFAKNS